MAVTVFNNIQFESKDELKKFLNEMDINQSVNLLLNAMMSAQSRGAFSTVESRALDEVFDKIQEESSTSGSTQNIEDEEVDSNTY
jgi:hypothetical protein